MGYEKIEPGVQRKDVDRRFTILRKTQIRNTAQRYRFNVVTQKFNTYVMYWTRICRQIEEGTFKRHVQKAARRFGAGNRRDQEMSIDVDMSDFDIDESEEMSMDDILAEANAAAEAYARGGNTDTVPPGMPTDPPSPMSSRPMSSRPNLRSMPPSSKPMISAPESTTSFAMTGSRETFDALPDDDDDATPQPMRAPPAHVHRAAAPLAGGSAKPRIVLRKRNDGDAPPPSTRQLEVRTPASPMSPVSPVGQHRAPTPTDRTPPSSSVIRPAHVQSSARSPGVASPRGPIPTAPESARRIPQQGPPPSVRERAMVDQAAAPPPSQDSRPKIAPPHARPQIAPRTPASTNTTAAPKPAPLRTPGVPMKPPGSVGKLGAPPAKPPPSVNVPASRPSVPDSDQPRPSRRPPPPLPSQLSKNKPSGTK